jgi:hypothetical protein
MSTWTERARAKILKTAGQGTIKTIETPSNGANSGGFEGFDGRAPSTFPKKTPLPDLPAFAERSAIVEHDGGLSRAEAERLAAGEQGFDGPDELYRVAVDVWRGEIAALPQLAGKEWERLAQCSLQFLAPACDWAMAALRLGWDEVDLFGVFEGDLPALRCRYDARGLVPSVALSAFPLKLATIIEDHAILTNTVTGARLRHNRWMTGGQYSIPWWRHLLLAPEI